jgi:hypothetical protein
MKRFDSLIKETMGLLDEADPNLDPALGGVPPDPTGIPADPGMDAGAPPTGAPPEEPEPEPEVTKLAPEGKRFLAELALKALAFDPGTLNDHDKAVFESEVTPENTEEVLTRIRGIIGGMEVPSTMGPESDIS